MHVCLYRYVHISIHTYLKTHVRKRKKYTYVNMYIHMYICMCVCRYIYIYLCICIWKVRWSLPLHKIKLKQHTYFLFLLKNFFFFLSHENLFYCVTFTQFLKSPFFCYINFILKSSPFIYFFVFFLFIFWIYFSYFSFKYQFLIISRIKFFLWGLLYWYIANLKL